MVKELRELNGLKSDNITFDEGSVQAFAEARAKENMERDSVTHDTSLTTYERGKKWENVGGTNLTTDVKNGKDSLILSDEQLAYEIVYGYFNEYTSMSYGHLNALLFGQGKFGFGVVTTNPDFLGNYDAFDSMQFVPETLKRSPQEALWSMSEDGSTPYLNGERIKFLPKTTFEYFVNETLTKPNEVKIQAKKALEDYKTQSTSQINSLKSQLSDAQNTLNTATVNVQSRQSALAKAQNSLTSAQADTKAKTQAVESAKATLSQKQGVLTSANEKVARVQAKLAQAELVAKDIVEAQNKTAKLQKQVDTLTAKLQETESSIKSLTETLTNAKAQEDGLKQAVVETSEALKQALAVKDETTRELAQKQAELAVAQGVLAQLKAKEDEKAKVEQTKNDRTKQKAKDIVGLGTTTKEAHQAVPVAYANRSVTHPGVGNSPTAKGQLPETGSQESITYLMAGLVLAGLGVAMPRKKEK